MRALTVEVSGAETPHARSPFPDFACGDNPRSPSEFRDNVSICPRLAEKGTGLKPVKSDTVNHTFTIHDQGLREANSSHKETVRQEEGNERKEKTMDVDNTHDKVADEKVVDGGAGFAQTETADDGGDVFNFEAWNMETPTEVPPQDDEEEDEHSIAGHWLDETEEPEVDAPEPVPPRGTMTQGAPQEEEEEEPAPPALQAARPTMLSSSAASFASSFALFSDPSMFDPENVRDGVHYLTDSLGGTVSLPFSSGLSTAGGAVSGSAVPGVQVDLVDCTTDEPVARTFSGTDGVYDFDLSNVLIRPGRYYATYRARRDMRVEGDTLPLERARRDGLLDGMTQWGPAAMTQGGTAVLEEDEFDCVPRGGEGRGYVDEAREVGDLDVGGYCARSAGCLEVGSRAALGGLFGRLEVLGGGSVKDLEGDKFAALPREGFWDVQFAREEWNLSTRQTASAEIYLGFPPDTPEEQLALGVPDNFANSQVKVGVEEAVLGVMSNMYNGLFQLDDIQVTGGHLGNMRGGTASAAFTSRRRGLRGSPDHGKGERYITYDISARGLEERAGSDGDGGLPPVFATVESTGARHLTVKVEKKPVVVLDSSGGFESWATVPLVLLGAAIASLTLAFLGRRVLVRRVAPRSKNRFGAYLEKGAGFEYDHNDKDVKNDDDVKRRSNYRSGGEDTWDGSSGSDGDAGREWGRRTTADTRSTAEDSGRRTAERGGDGARSDGGPGDEGRKKRRKKKKKKRTADP
ncbi:hypothetical protein THAOC_33599 [Thalassiosira oceanica]|uniref:Uncharacterized protein n=1 Tax=Thalassiosira oceanica TaxID=159749 RepID=K0RF85_THAOC|nr:hypothetical protein THAOC_33599 [Thalassiosira oceanica]|eukprot:EJK47666.1 hypothetical protein THAOC_33599 [Thalassiosira oceanica]